MADDAARAGHLGLGKTDLRRPSTECTTVPTAYARRRDSADSALVRVARPPRQAANKAAIGQDCTAALRVARYDSALYKIDRGTIP